MLKNNIEKGSVVSIFYNSGRKSCTFHGRLRKIGLSNVVFETLGPSGHIYRIPLKHVRKIVEES